MYQTLYDCTNIRLNLHNYIYPQFENKLIDIISNHIPISKIYTDDKSEKTISISLSQNNINTDILKEKVIDSFINFLNLNEVSTILKDKTSEEEYMKYKYITCTRSIVPNLYNLTILSTKELNDTLVIIL